MIFTSVALILGYSATKHRFNDEDIGFFLVMGAVESIAEALVALMMLHKVGLL